ncbi:hypothetical protein ABOM_003928 [Aspergillus bombycis]|uniref:F-box domain-containing protein n=1 Tax=Aspergillus bombycis TaxID=109264 RepID=A0A1F8A7A1_9EURO|nr:hypothetical protein ABOM_003928 [Aspergillus bombycis]OGM47235.1 hypothetical protein ABOM_003928 [Aspergillus bombycis]
MDPEIQDMDVSNKYCPICGVVLLCEDEPEDPSETQRPWYAEVRATVKQDYCDNFMTGVGFLGSRDILCAPLDEELDYSNAMELEDVELLRTESPLHGFGLHDSCWMLLQDRLWHTIDSEEIAQSLYDQFFCTPSPLESSLSFGHDYGGAKRWQRAYADVPMPEDMPLLLQTDPYAIPLLERLEENAPDVDAGRETHSASPTSSTDINTGYLNSFGRMSLELLHEVVSYLSVPELLDLRYTCRELARRVVFCSLPQSFWKRQFARGNDMDFLFPDLEQTRDWFRLYRGTVSILHTKDQSPERLSLLNRKRIRALLEPIASVVEADSGRSKEPRGRRANCLEFRPGHWLVSEGLTQWRAENIYTAYISVELEVLPHGCRVPRYRISAFPHTMLHGGEIKISTVRLGARVFISGISHHSQDTQVTTEQAVGYGDLTGEITINVPPGAIFNQIELAFCPEGLRGIRFHFGGNTISDWVGDSGDENMSYGVLQIPHSASGVYHILAGTDTYKLTALGTIHDEARADTSNDPFWRDYPLDLTLPNSYLWQSKRPSYDTLQIYQFQPDNVGPPYRPLMNIDFGGPGGEWLGSLISMEVHVSSESSPILGMTFNYTDKALRFGGERIIDVVGSTTGHSDSSTIYGLKVTTSLSREIEFQPDNPCDGSRSPGMLSPDRRYVNERPRGSVITGFVATQRWGEEHFIEFGIQVQLLDRSDESRGA